MMIQIRKLFYTLLLPSCITLILFLSGCNNESVENNNAGAVKIVGDMAMLTFDVEDADFTANVFSRSASERDTITQELGDGYVLETVIAPEVTPVLSRAVTSIVNDGVKVLVISYLKEGSSTILYKKEVATVNNGRISIHLPVDKTFNLLFYANNDAGNTENPYLGNYISGTLTEGDATAGPESGFFGTGSGIATPTETTRDMMWAAINNLSVTATTKLPGIIFEHLFCQAKLTVTCADNMTEVQAVLAPQAYNSATVDISKDNASARWTGINNNTVDLALNMSDASGTKSLSASMDFIPFETGDITLKYDKITIKGKNYSAATPYTFVGKTFVRGNRYNIASTVKKPAVYTLTVNTNPANITTPTITPSEAEYTRGEEVTVSVPDRVIYNGKNYKFLDWEVSPTSLSVDAGHEITITMPSSDVTLTANYLEEGGSWITTFKGWALGDLVLTGDGKLAIGEASKEGPAFMFGSLIGVDIQSGNVIFKPEEYNGGATHAKNVPYIKTTKSPEDKNSNDIAGMTNPAQGIGDICLYASQKWPENFNHKLWRMPSNNEFKNDLGGGKYGGSPVVYTFKDATGGSMQMYCWGYWYGVNSSTMHRGSYGPRWTATMTTNAGWYGSGSPAAYVVALGAGVYPDYPWGRNSAFNVRCVLFDK